MRNSTSSDALKYLYKPPIDKHEDYYEAKIQLRPFDEELIRFTIKQIDERKDVRISKVEELKTGVDIYVSSQRFARALGKKLKQRFKQGKLITSRTLFSRNKQTSKDIYRVTVLFRL